MFRITDATLWFDGDGAGGKRARLIADLDGAARLGAADIILL